MTIQKLSPLNFSRDFRLAMILAHDLTGGIGYQNKLAWDHIKEDMEFFKYITEDCIVIMGRKTFESLGCKPLKGRYNIVITSEPDRYNKEITNLAGFEAVSNLDQVNKAIMFANRAQPLWSKKVVAIGGESVYNMFYGLADTIYTTEICDTYLTDVASEVPAKLLLGLDYQQAEVATALHIDCRDKATRLNFNRYVKVNS